MTEVIGLHLMKSVESAFTCN